MIDSILSEEDASAIKEILVGYKKDGVVNPLLPSDFDFDGDGITDAFGLDENDNVVLVSGAKIEDTVYVSDGDDISNGGEV